MRINDMKSNTLSNGGLAGMFVTRQECPLQVYTVSWDQPTIFQPLAAVGDDGELMPWRDPEDQEQLTGWLAPVPRCVRGVGTVRRITFNTELSEDEREQYVDTPFDHFYRSMESLKDEHQDVARLLKGANNQSAPLSKPKSCLLIQGVLYMHNGKDYSRKPKTNICLMLSPTATKTLGEVLSVVGEGGADILGDIFNYNDPTFFHFMKDSAAFMLPAKWQCLADSEPEELPANVQVFPHHATRLVLPPKGLNRDITADYNKQVFIPWDNVIRQLSAEEQVKLIASAFHPRHVLMGFENSEFEQFVPEFIHESGSRSMSGSQGSNKQSDEEETQPSSSSAHTPARTTRPAARVAPRPSPAAPAAPAAPADPSAGHAVRTSTAARPAAARPGVAKSKPVVTRNKPAPVESVEEEVVEEEYEAPVDGAVGEAIEENTVEETAEETSEETSEEAASFDSSLKALEAHRKKMQGNKASK